MVGAMGGASPLALGVALNTPAKIVVLDGDGAALMKMGVFATIGTEQPSNLLHIVLDNGAHDSTGGQATARLISPVLQLHADMRSLPPATIYKVSMPPLRPHPMFGALRAFTCEFPPVRSPNWDGPLFRPT